MTDYTDNREITFTKVSTLAGSDLIRVVASGSSRNMTLTNFLALAAPQLNTTKNVVTSTTNYAASISNDVILMDLTSASLAVTLPNAALAGGKLITIKKIDGTTNDITVQTDGGNIDGSATATLSGSGGAKPSAAFISDGSNWYILNA